MMYKTIRHGETSLQYTILPQHDDFRVDGKLIVNDCKEGCATRQPPTRRRKRSFIAYFGLVFVCTVIVGAILVPFLVSTEYLSNPSTWFMKKKTLLSDTQQNDTNHFFEQGSNSTMGDRATPTLEATTPKTKEMHDSTETTTGAFRKIYSSLVRTFATSSPIATTGRKGHSMITEPPIQQSTTVKQPVKIIVASYKEPTASSTNRSESSKSPVILPVLAKTNLVAKENGKIVQAPEKPQDWIRSHWPFIDPSTYFQWAGYKSEDSVLLPAILGAALIGIMLIITLCLVTRNKKTIAASIKKRNRDVSVGNAEDNTTLLSNGVVSDDE